MRLSQVFRQKECVFSIEVFPPKKNGATPESLYPTLEKLAGLSPDYISVTYGAGGGKAGLSTVQIARHLKQELGVEPLAHLTGINSTREQVAETVQALQEAGIENVLTLRGDICPDAPRSKDFFHASDLATFVKGKGDFYLAGACYPEGHVESETLRQDVENLKYKLDAGVEHLVTQLFFDNARYYRFMNLVRKAGIQAPVQAGVMPIVSARQVQRTVAERWKAQTGSNILEAYGLTEASPGVCGNIPNAPWDGSVGCPLPSTEVTIRGDGFEDLGLCPEGGNPEDYTGEICVRGPQVMSGYWKKPEETANVLRDGWLRTGDVGYMNHRGVITITDRKKDMILVSGFNVYPNEVENVIASMPGVLEVGVVGIPSAKSGETVKAVIVRKDPTLTEDDVRKYCRTQLTGYKVPKKIVFVESLPKTPVGKILRRELKDLA